MRLREPWGHLENVKTKKKEWARGRDEVGLGRKFYKKGRGERDGKAGVW